MSLFEAASGLAVRYLNRDRLLALRAGYHAGRSKLYPLMRAWYGTFDAASLRRHLEERLGDFEILMVHNSVNHMQPTYTGGPLDLVRMLIELCGPRRTLTMPTFNFGDSSIGTSATFRANPRFDVRRTPSQMGLATELFRRTKGVVHSRHPTYRVSAIGPLAQELTTGHELTGSAFGRGTPFEYMDTRKTLIIGIGKRFDVLTHVHQAEAIMGDEFPVPRSSGERLAITLVDGKEELLYQLDTAGLVWKRDMWKLRQIMPRARLLEWRFHNVPIFATRSADVTTALIDAAHRGVTLYKLPRGVSSR
jgi:aminoglycoside 3-N-acetyltransferase